jgi:hypothetical protein
MNLEPKSAGPMRPMLPPTTRPQPVESIRTVQTLKEYPFLKAALEDLEEIQLCDSRKVPNRRHIVCLMFDVLEFVLYEILLLHERDIYRSGQHTIGFDDALSACKELGVECRLAGGRDHGPCPGARIAVVSPVR